MILRAALIVLGLLLSFPAAAQAPNNQISYAAVLKAKPGSWAEYVMSKAGEPDEVRVRYTLVRRDAKQIVLEIDSQTPLGRMLMRLEFAPDGAERHRLAKAIMKLGDGAPRETPIPEGSSSYLAKDTGPPTGRESIAVKAGKFTADHYHREGEWKTDAWIDDAIAPIGLVKLTDAQGSLVELTAVGKNGKSAF